CGPRLPGGRRVLLPRLGREAAERLRPRRQPRGGLDRGGRRAHPHHPGRRRPLELPDDAPLRPGAAAGGAVLSRQPPDPLAGGAALHTTGAGLPGTCLPAQLGPEGLPAELWAVSFRDLQTGWLAGKHLLRRTTDGGQTWSDVTVHHPGVPGFTLADVELYSLS